METLLILSLIFNGLCILNEYVMIKKHKAEIKLLKIKYNII